MDSQIHAWMSTSFDRLAENLSLAEARETLQADRLGIVVSAEGEPVAIVTKGDLEQAAEQGTRTLRDTRLPPVVIVGAAVEMHVLADSAAMSFFAIGARGAVVVGEEHSIAGVLPVEALDEYLGSGVYEPAPTIMSHPAKAGDAGLGGAHQTPAGKVRCVHCGFMNTLTFVDEERLPECQNPEVPKHPLALQ